MNERKKGMDVPSAELGISIIACVQLEYASKYALEIRSQNAKKTVTFRNKSNRYNF